MKKTLSKSSQTTPLELQSLSSQKAPREEPSIVTILGCGPSAGVPLVGTNPEGFWGKCDPKNPKNYRTRSSIYVRYKGLNLVVDTSPDLRTQLLRENFFQVDGVLLTHSHADHVNGIDELRSLFFAQGKKPIPLYGDRLTLQAVQSSFSYLFSQGALSIYPQILTPKVIDETFDIQDVPIISFSQHHGPGVSRGYRFGGMAYSTDFNHLEQEALNQLEGISLWIIDCMDLEPRPTHCHLDLTLRWIDIIKPKQAILTHLNCNMDYDSLCKMLPGHIVPAYDGLQAFF